MRTWDESVFNEHLGNKTEWGMIMGMTMSGKSLVAQTICDNASGKIVDVVKMAEKIKDRLGSEEDGPFEGRVPDAELEKDILAMVEADKAAGSKAMYLFDGQHHETVEAWGNFLASNIGAPSFLVVCSAGEKDIEKRYAEKNELDAATEEDQAMLKEKSAAAVEDVSKLKACWGDMMSRVKEINLDTSCSKESLTEEIRGRFCAKVILVNHEKRIEVDVACSNIAIKFNMLYLSVYQMIKAEIEAESDLGRSLEMSRREKGLDFGPTAKSVDPFDEARFSAVHYDPTLVMSLVQSKIAENRTNQRYILLEGFCNSNKLESEEQRLQLRFMDEFFSIERNIGEVVGVISLQAEKEITTFELPADQYEEPEEVKEEVKAAPADGDDAGDDPPADVGDDGEPKKPKFNPKEFRWSLTNGRSKNLPILFRNTKSGNVSKTTNFDEKNWTAYQATSHGDAAVKALDEFCQKINEEGQSIYLYQQVIFNDQD